MERSRVVLLSFLILLTAAATVSQAEIPQMISYQGKVTDTGGSPVVDGNWIMRFRIYDAATSGTMLWDSGDRLVAVAGGVFSILLGESPQPALSLAFDADYWLQVTFDGVTQTPRQRLSSAGYAYMASGLVAGTEVSGAVTSGTLAAIKGANTATAGALFGVYGESASPAGSGVYGYAYNSGNNYGVYGKSVSSGGVGIFGETSATSGTTCGVYGLSVSTAGRGVYGDAIATSGLTYGVYGHSTSTAGRGVFGYAVATTGTTYGVHGQSSSTSGRGVYGYATATSGYTYGVYGRTDSTDGRGVYGTASASSGVTYGVFGQSASIDGRAVYGSASSTSGSAYNYGGYFETASRFGTGVFGVATSTEAGSFGVRGMAPANMGYALYASGDFAATGSKSCVVKTSKGPALLYCQESPENWFEDFGEGTLVNGRCHIELDPVFLETVTIDPANPMKVFVQACDESCLDLVVKRGQTAFEVVSPTRPDAAGAFMYRVVAKRKGFEAKRLDVCEAARTDSYLYPELREKERAKREAERARMESESTGSRQ